MCSGRLPRVIDVDGMLKVKRVHRCDQSRSLSGQDERRKRQNTRSNSASGPTGGETAPGGDG
jgi:hypothetical protein